MQQELEHKLEGADLQDLCQQCRSMVKAGVEPVRCREQCMSGEVSLVESS